MFYADAASFKLSYTLRLRLQILPLFSVKKKKIFIDLIRMSGYFPEEVHIRHCMLFLFQRGNSATEATKAICEAYGNVLKLNKCQRWFRKFQSGDYELSDRRRSGRPVEIDEEMLQSLVESDPRQTIQELSEKLSSSWSAVQEHLQKIGKISRHGIWVPHQLSENNKIQRITICSSLLTRQQNEPFLQRIVTGDEKWVLYVNNKRKRQWLSPAEVPVPTPKPNIHAKKVLLCIWWDYVGIIHHELSEVGQTVTAAIDCQQ